MPGDALPMGDYLAAAVEVPPWRRVQLAPDVVEGSHPRTAPEVETPQPKKRPRLRTALTPVTVEARPARSTERARQPFRRFPYGPNTGDGFDPELGTDLGPQRRERKRHGCHKRFCPRPDAGGRIRQAQLATVSGDWSPRESVA